MAGRRRQSRRHRGRGTQRTDAVACELALVGIRPVVLDVLPGPSSGPKANGFVGQVVRMLDLGADGGHSFVRKEVGIDFPGTTAPTVTRLAHVQILESLRAVDRSLQIPGFGRIPHGHNRVVALPGGWNHPRWHTSRDTVSPSLTLRAA
jgi:hypothetical protein